MSDVRPELQQIREALELLETQDEHAMYLAFMEGDPAGDALAALAQVEATLNEAEPLPASTVCACLDETGSRQVRVYERCERCHALMESGLPADLAAAEARVVAAEAERETMRTSWRENVAELTATYHDAVVAAEAERDALVAALEEIARMTEPHCRIGGARHTAREALAARPAPAEPPRERDA